MRRKLPLPGAPTVMVGLALLLAATISTPQQVQSQDREAATGEWKYLGGDAWHTRSSSLDQIDASNFEDLRVEWVWRGDNFGPSVDFLFRSTPSYVDGKLFTVAGQRRTVAAIDPGTGETLWIFREPHTVRWERSPRKNYGKGVAYGEVDGQGVIYITTPAFFLWALDAETGRPLKDWGTGVDLEGFPDTGVVDLLADLGRPYDPYEGYPDPWKVITSSSPPIVVNGVVVVGNSHEQGYYQTRKENVPGDILAYDAATGEHLWKFNIIPRPGEFGHDTWEDGSWEYSGDVSSWAPMSADPERGLVYIPTNGPTNDFYGGHRPGDGLYGTSVIALDVETGERAWHYQIVRHDLWNYDTPTAPILMDVEVDGERIPGLFQATKQGWVYSFNRETGEPIWPIEDREVPRSEVPGEWIAGTQPFPTRPEPFEMQGLSEDDLIDFTPELREEALEILSDFDWGPIFNPPLHMDNDRGKIASIHCPGSNGGANIPGPPAADPGTGILYVPTIKGCSAPRLIPGTEVDPDSNMDYVTQGPGGVSGPRGLPIFKPPYSRIVAIDMNTGEHLWEVVNGDTPDRIRNHPDLQDIDVPRTGNTGHAVPLLTETLLIHGEGRGGSPLLHAVDKATGEALGSVEIPASAQYGMMTYMHEGRQYIVVQVASGALPGSLVALRLP